MGAKNGLIRESLYSVELGYSNVTRLKASTHGAWVLTVSYFVTLKGRSKVENRRQVARTPAMSNSVANDVVQQNV